jgi:hypothetical protein
MADSKFGTGPRLQARIEGDPASVRLLFPALVTAALCVALLDEVKPVDGDGLEKLDSRGRGEVGVDALTDIWKSQI